MTTSPAHYSSMLTNDYDYITNCFTTKTSQTYYAINFVTICDEPYKDLLKKAKNKGMI